jgi:hypothetical protein
MLNEGWILRLDLLHFNFHGGVQGNILRHYIIANSHKIA